MSTPSDPITATDTNRDVAAMGDKRIAHRNTHLWALGARPRTEAGGTASPWTFVIDFYNPTDEHVDGDLVFDRRHFPGELSLFLPKLDPKHPLDGFKVVLHDRVGERMLHSLGIWFEHLGELPPAHRPSPGVLHEAQCSDPMFVSGNLILMRRTTIIAPVIRDAAPVYVENTTVSFNKTKTAHLPGKSLELCAQ